MRKCILLAGIAAMALMMISAGCLELPLPSASIVSSGMTTEVYPGPNYVARITGSVINDGGTDLLGVIFYGKAYDADSNLIGEGAGTNDDMLAFDLFSQGETDDFTVWVDCGASEPANHEVEIAGLVIPPI